MKSLLVMLGAIIAASYLQLVMALHLSEATYLVTVSSRLTAGNQETVCALIQTPTEPVTLTITLDLDSSSTKIGELSFQTEIYRCFQFMVPMVSSTTVGSISVKIRGRVDVTTKETKVLIEPPAFIHIVQTDKPIYKPGQTVQFRIVSMDTNFIPVSRQYKEVTIQDPNSNRIAQWLNESIDGGILDLSHPTIPEAAQGIYVITAETDKGETISYNFEIKEYVLPKFEVTVNLPSVITILDEEVTIEICGKYTYGKLVLGSVKAEFCRRAITGFWLRPSQSRDICKTFRLTTDKSGCASETLPLEGFGLYATNYFDSFELTADLEEFGTGVTLKASGSARFTTRVRTITFEDVSSAYKPGLPFNGKIKVVGADGSPVVFHAVYLYIKDSLAYTFYTDQNGIATFSLDTSLWSESVSLSATTTIKETNPKPFRGLRLPDYGTAYHYVRRFHSTSNSYVGFSGDNEDLPCDKDGSLWAQYIIQGEDVMRGQRFLNFYYLVESKGSIVQQGVVPGRVQYGIVNKGYVRISLKNVMDLAPVAQVAIYTIVSSGQIVADSRDFPVQLCLKNKVSLEFSATQELPGAKTTLTLQAQPSSLCSVRAIDQSVLLLKSEKELTTDYVYNQLPVQKMWGYDYRIEDRISCSSRPWEIARIGWNAIHRARRDRNSRMILPIPEGDDVRTVFKNIGVRILTNSDGRASRRCTSNFLGKPSSFESMPMKAPASPPEGQKTETVRTYFPETWIWDLVSVGSSGSTSLEKTVPDTITKWAAGAFCVSPAGFGVAPNVGLTAFQPFFVSLTLPYSVVRGEVFTLKATVFNYLPKCIMVKVTLANSDQFTFQNCDGCVYSSVCLCAEESKTFSWIVTPTALGDVSLKVSAEAERSLKRCGKEKVTVPTEGRIDTVITNLLVEAEGVPQMVSYNALLCPANGPVSKNISLELPEEFVTGSERASVSVLGDLMGRAMKNLDKLLAMPYGCGEQNMLLFAPNIFILDYLKSTGQLKDSTLKTAVGYLESGYQRELNYKHDDGSYSAFGMSDASGNTWLTTFVMKSFNAAKSYIFVDQKYVQDARTWLSGLQKPDGCIQSVGRLFHNGMKGGVSDDVSLTAYVAAAMLELDGNADDPVVQNCLKCLQSAAEDNITNLYTVALMSYTFTLAGDEDMRSKLITQLDEESTNEGGSIHWKRDGASETDLDSVEVEMTSYVLLALLSGPSLPDFGLDYAAGIVRWLAQQQNPFGGFSSTQDTVVALQALAKYASATYSPEGSTTVTVTSAGGLNKQFTINNENRLLYQEEKLSEIPGEYTIKAEGQSCVLAQISLFYNIPPPSDFSAFQISTDTRGRCDLPRPEFMLFVHVKFQGRREETNMVVINIKLLSGYILQDDSLKMLKENRLVKRVDVEEGFINIYLDGLKKDQEETLDVTLEEDQQVENLKPAVVKVYDYYQTSDQAVTDYTSPCKK
ncbi:alpha-2-macroglobulin-like protein 1 isoform X3 [Oryzias melastigma]|uniref:alpha-2-macroglobulin-like protein 1 isoform X2 n=1 Tax=Oryzias melastigma TaxID=30732 RepID=UPI000CF807D8|nr:alpha-2-macroglobulin-like protein 1 isoform X2 [Oryzias melastigma]XP_024144819.1 alpha-2-macroglobulin-like protein 1 isoform X3 [Oryzias melastigma]